jgi:histidinol-phosphate aminotransferase
MYEVSANINDVEIVNIPLLPNFQLDKNAIFESIDQDPTIKLIFICSPNNPTGNLISGIDEIVARFNGIVVVDEAYIDFSPESTKIQSIYSHNNLIVLQTLSKAWGLAGVRVGFAFAQPEIIALLNKIKAPYNISILNQQEALLKLLKTDEFEAERDEILAERERMEKELLQLPIVRKIYPSSANFLLVEIIDENNVYKTLVGKNIIVRNRDSVIKNCMRITVGTKEENNSLLTGLKDISL